MAHSFEPLVQIGKEGLTEGLFAELDRVLAGHELVKVRFREGPGREEKAALTAAIESRLDCVEVGRVGHVAVFFRPHSDPEQRKIHLLGR